MHKRGNKVLDNKIKIEHLNNLSEYRTSIIKRPPLKSLFLELTTMCNQNCIHCGSNCGKKRDNELTAEQYKDFLLNFKNDFDINSIMLNITGGEPLLRQDFFEIMSYANDLGYIWGMTSNGTLIDDEIAKKLKQCGMRTISISIDGLEQTHDRFRQRSGAYKKAMNGIKALINNGQFENVQVTTVVTHNSINELDRLFEIFDKIDINSWRIINVEPIGRAIDRKDVVLNKNDYINMFSFIREKRIQGYPITYGCSHFLGIENEMECRDWYFLCSSGIYTASITSEGDICGCLDVERRFELIQGNILKDNFKEIWEKEFKIFRKSLSDESKFCKQCEMVSFCHGGSFHTWDFEKNKQKLCFKNILF